MSTMAMVQQQRVVMTEEAWRRSVKRLGKFTVSELAADLGCSQAAARKHIEAMMKLDPPLVAPDGRLGRKPIYAYIKPTDAGERFTRQRALSSSVAPEVMAASMAAPRDVEVRQSKLGSIATKELRDVAKEAVERGWTYEPANGSSKARLTLGRRMVKIPSSPRNAGAAASQMRQQLFGESARRRRREALGS